MFFEKRVKIEGHQLSNKYVISVSNQGLLIFEETKRQLFDCFLSSRKFNPKIAHKVVMKEEPYLSPEEIIKYLAVEGNDVVAHLGAGNGMMKRLRNLLQILKID